MPAHIFELHFVYYKLKEELGKPPTTEACARVLGIDVCTVLQRRDRAIAIGVIVDPGFQHGNGKPWAVFTDRGADAFMAIMDGLEEAPAKPGTLLCTNRDIFPDTLRYVYLPMPEYCAYVKELSGHVRQPAS